MRRSDPVTLGPRPASNRLEASRRTGFTLLETLAAVMVTALIVAFALGAYVQIADTSEQATLRLRDDLHAATIMDRLAEDLRSAFLVVKPDELDPLSHPWYFVSESRESFSGSDAIRFIGRRHRSYQPDEHSSDFAQVAYQVTTDEEGLQSLHRWVVVGLPDAYEPVFPLTDDERSHVLGQGLSGFTLRFLDGEGEWVETWDSTQLEQSSTLPISIEIAFDMGLPPEDDGFGEPQYVRRVVLPMQPLDVQGMIVAAAEQVAGIDGSGDEDDPDGEDAAEAQALLQCIQQACLGQFSGEVCAAVNALGASATLEQLLPYAGQAGC